jgi:tetratricopeptide (TPR) repeat protein
MINSDAKADSSSFKVLRKESRGRRSPLGVPGTAFSYGVLTDRNSACSTRHAARYFYIACFTFLSFRLLASLTGTAYADSAADDGKKLSAGSAVTTRIPKNISGLQLLKADISIAGSENDTKSKEQLRRIIEQVRSVEFKPQEQPPEPVIKPEKAPVTEPNETVPELPVQKQEPEQEAKSKLPYEPITDQTLQMLRALAQNPGKLENPLELGEIVFASGNVKEASICYREALRRKDPNDAGSSADRAWILFQIGNCLRNDDRPSAAKAYQQLIKEYPNSPWTQPAKARHDLIAWYLKDKPAELMKQVKSTPVQQDNVR